ncbi:hypothetical protein FLW53_23505 [Microbispora sp. SCL1-1]|uniref:hypothetical protein n=1 Tax=unclassified Microbispora TaxID=2614687 RepID=UPI001157D565|nr:MULTISPECIES: hypothetical protein [unclassified Microbispora]NJP27112.1 hypothetical protein [Microbispora sp. CL1-1]TQS11457.1 hypothetical protein FLW53_23505 [Microbispora sp. SCL1-1]
MAWSKSGYFVSAQVGQWGAAQLGINLLSGMKLALWGSSVTPNYDSDTAYGTSPWNSGESSGAGYTAGGVTLANPTLVGSSGVMAFDADNVQWDESTITSEGGIVYASAKSNRLWLGIWWGAPKSTQDGTFLITWHSSGIGLMNLVP